MERRKCEERPQIKRQRMRKLSLSGKLELITDENNQQNQPTNRTHLIPAAILLLLFDTLKQ